MVPTFGGQRGSSTFRPVHRRLRLTDLGYNDQSVVVGSVPDYWRVPNSISSFCLLPASNILLPHRASLQTLIAKCRQEQLLRVTSLHMQAIMTDVKGIFRHSQRHPKESS